MFVVEIAKQSLAILDHESLELIEAFIKDQIAESGGFKDRDGKADLYYTLFGLDCMNTLGVTIDVGRFQPFFDQFGDGAELDLVDFTCLTRSLLRIGETKKAERLVSSLDRYQSADGGYCPDLSCQSETIYSSYLALQTLTEFGRELSGADHIRKSTIKLRLDDGSYGEQSATGTTTVTSAAHILLVTLAQDIDTSTISWLEDRRHSSGGFCASPVTPLPDLLSTAAAELALQTAGADLEGQSEKTADFVEDMWHDEGGFCGHIMDTTPDCEYTFYGLLTLGLCSLRSAEQV